MSSLGAWRRSVLAGAGSRSPFGRRPVSDRHSGPGPHAGPDAGPHAGSGTGAFVGPGSDSPPPTGSGTDIGVGTGSGSVSGLSPVPDSSVASGTAPASAATSAATGTASAVGSATGSWGEVRPFSIKTKLGTLVVVSVFITTGLLMIAVRTETELRFITVFSVIATLLITQFVAHSLTSPLDEMNTVARGISHGDYTRRVRGADRRDELGDLAQTINRMADDLEAQERQRKELVANVSHELRTPIAGLRAVLENVVDGVSAADPETMRTALKQTERLGRLVETLLDLSRLDNGVVPLRKRRFEVWPYLSGVLKEANMVASARAGIASGSGSHTRTDVHLHLDVSPPELTAHADPERIHQVVANLIDNAVKHSPPHGRVTVKARRGEGHESLDLEVLDEGPGIPRSEWHRVFERFNRGGVVAPHGPGSDGGTGLGLAIARWAVDLHGGRIGVAESPRGCRIQVTLPGVPSLDRLT
ncbi:signal transduction histidine kinase [Streptomyces phaeochromogenes]|jgi:signal transduction histidine kinase|nr:signal transduction histidine kinase [Streptomyces phaeochromogenes]